MSVPVPVTAPLSSSVPEETSAVPSLVAFGVMTLVPVPPVFSKRPWLVIADDFDLPSAMPLLSRMSQVPVEAIVSLATSPDASPSVVEPPLSVSVPPSLNVVVPPIVSPATVVVPLASSVPAPLVVALENASVPVSVSESPLEMLTVAPASALKLPE